MPAQDVTAYLTQLLESVRGLDRGAPHDLPVHADADTDLLAVAVVDVDGQVWSAGDAEHLFPIQSMSKPAVYGLAIEHVGLDEVLRHVDVEPSGDAFNRISLDPESNLPDNPMINAGALVAHSLVHGPDAGDRFERIQELHSRMAGRELAMDQDCYEQEMERADRNLALAHLVKALSVLPDDPHDVGDGYSRQCSLEVSTVELARIGATLAAGGVVPGTGERVLAREATQQVLSVMLTCGMYDSAGDWVSQVGIPAKSGISGGIFGAVPGRCGIATYSPRLDAHGTSVRGELAFRRLSLDLGLHVLRPRRPQG
ncbi:MAG: glutaminase A [Acidobacteria bacterium]|nr:MAG: glutaminase A [Acidobacteriota bacterium]